MAKHPRVSLMCSRLVSVKEAREGVHRAFAARNVRSGETLERGIVHVMHNVTIVPHRPELLLPWGWKTWAVPAGCLSFYFPARPEHNNVSLHACFQSDRYRVVATRDISRGMALRLCWRDFLPTWAPFASALRWEYIPRLPGYMSHQLENRSQLHDHYIY